MGATGQVLINYLEALSNCVEYTPGQALFDFAFGLGWEVIGSYVGDSVAKWGPQAVARGLRKLGFDDEAEKLLRNADELIDSVDNGKNDNNTPSTSCAFNSFSADTEVATQEGAQAISTLEIGDMVLAYNEATGEIDYYPVIATISHEDPVVQYLTIDDETIVTTPNHPFYTTGGEWVNAGELQIGDAILRANGEFGIVTATIYDYQPQHMYNLTVDTAHTYFVGDEEWLVHNSNGCLGKLTSTGPGEWTSSGGLKYTSNDPNFPNRVQHVLNHTKDIPTRPGLHGVFDSSRTDTLAIVDEAWQIVQKQNITPKTNGSNYVYDVPMGRRVGYVGGSGGAALGNPEAKNITLVLRKNTNEVITAFPTN